MPGRKAWPWVVLLLALAFVQRAGVVVAARADLYGTSPDGELHVNVGEEIARGNLAQDLLEGPLLPLLDYQYAHFFGGSLVIGLLTVPSFAAFGPRLWALKLVPVLIHLLGVALVFRALDRHVSRRAAILGGLLYACTPPGPTLLSTVAFGSHVESNTLALLALNLALDLRGSARPWPGRFGLGLVLGFGVYFGYQFVLVVGALGLFDLTRRTWPGARALGVQAAGFLVGFSPWLVYNLRHGFRGLSIYGASVTGHLESEGQGTGARLAHLVTHGLPGSLFTGSAALDAGLALVAALLFALGVQGRSAPALRAAAYALVFGVAYALSDFPIGDRPDSAVSFRYAYLLAPWVAVGVGCGLDRLAGLAGARGGAIAASTAGSIALVGLAASWWTCCDPGRLGADRDHPGVNLEAHARWILMKYSDEPERVPDVAAAIVARRDVGTQGRMFGAMGDLVVYLGHPGPRASDTRRAEAERMRVLAETWRRAVPAAFVDDFTPTPRSPADAPGPPPGGSAPNPAR